MLILKGSQKLRTHLEYLYLQILSVVTQSQLHAIFSKRSNFDLRRLLEGTEGIMQSLLEGLQDDTESMMGALRVLPLELGLRDECAQLLKPTTKSQVCAVRPIKPLYRHCQ